MTGEIQALSGRLAAEPDSLAVLPLGEALRQRGQLDAALAVALGGVQRHPDLADAHDLLGRIRSDRGEGDGAFEAWTAALRIDPRHVGALRGLAFLAFRVEDYLRAERHLEAAVGQAPDDRGLRAGLARVRERLRRQAPPPLTLEDGDAHGTLLVDSHGRRLAGVFRRPDGADISDAVAGELARVSREATRTTRLLGLGEWRGLSVEGRDASLHLVPPTPDTVLLASGDVDTPPGRLALVAERAAAAARRWIERLA